MGFGLPAAIGAADRGARTCRRVLLTGDGSFQMNIQELATARQYDVPVKCVIMDNGYLGMVRQWQELFWDRRYSNVDMGTVARLGQARRRLRGDRRAADRQDDAGRRPADRSGHARPGRRRRQGHARGEHVSDDRAGRGRAGDGGLSMGEPATKEILSLEELEASAGVRTGRKHILSILVENKPGVLTRIAGLFARRGFNIDTLAVGPTDDPDAVAHHADAGRRDAPDRSGDQAAPQAGQRDQDPRSRAGRDGRPGARAVQDLRRRRFARRGHADGRDLPRQDHRRRASAR